MQRGREAAKLLSRVSSTSISRLFSWPARSYCSQVTRQIIKMSYTIEERGAPYTLDYRVFFRGPNGKVCSPFHDIPLYANTDKTEFNMVVEVPRWTNAKMEIDTKSKMNPIKQDIKKGNLRFVHNCFPHHGYIWNYGALPQTWEEPNHVDENTGAKGDNDPLDVCEIGYKVHKRGDVVKVKVLGCMALIDEGETDWKVIAIDTEDPLAPQLNDIDDVEKHLPGFLKATTEWFRIYKIPSGKPENQFAFDGQCKNREFAHKVIQETNKFWMDLVGKNIENDELACENISVMGSPYLISGEEANSVVDSQPPPATEPAPIPDEVDKWHYVALKENGETEVTAD